MLLSNVGTAGFVRERRSAGLPSAVEEEEETAAFWTGALGEPGMPFLEVGRMTTAGRSPLFSIGVTVHTPALPLLLLVLGRTATPGSCIHGAGVELTSLSTSSLLRWPSASFVTLLFSVTPASSYLLHFLKSLLSLSFFGYQPCWISEVMFLCPK